MHKEDNKQLQFYKVDNTPKPIFRSKYLKWKYENNFRKANDFSTERCCNCKHFSKNIDTNIIFAKAGNYYKCELLGRSNSSATDVRLSNVCNLYEVHNASNQ